MKKQNTILYVVYSHTNTSGNILKHNLRASMKRTNTLLYKNISLILYSQKGWCFCGVWEMSGETYTQREDFFFPYLLPGPRGCQCLHPLASSSETPLIGCVSLARLRFSALSLNLITWCPPGYTPVVPDCPDVLSCWLITTWQLVKAHGITRNEPKIYGICYITLYIYYYFD